ncbi:BtrH N-terminal domain-containing protein [Microbacterium sp. HD4P20]|uniref:BtrH N-terminal domain-containing protein n=1 Tax=Microbacterium sp. HD4P20 TaxID=2864874 RepID=UPI0020A47CEF|nr:BtrH N-terminal domain-containing protein [Microbacterium sp. HD4P20]MCP2636840.1 BtrH N-terminal domain-containing protein [Microbacterium sp. HD4P20]
MTARKAFKARVRAEMSASGRTYAQAAAMLEAGNPARPADAHPASALVVALLRAHGMDLAPEAAFGVGGGIGFMYAVFTYAEVDHPLLTIVCQHHPAPWAPTMLDRLGIPHVQVKTKALTVALLRDRRPVILPLARGSLNWLHPSADEREEQVVLILPAEEGGCRVLDGSGSAQTMSVEDIVTAYMLSRRKHPVIAVEEAAGAQLDVATPLRAGLRACVAGMTGPVLGNSFDVNFGLSGLEKWAQRADGVGRDDWPALFGSNPVWRTRLVDGIEREHTAPTAGRPLFARTLRLANLDAAAAAFERSAGHWRTISHRAGSGTLTYSQLAHEVRRIRDLEAEGTALLAEKLR